MKLVKRYLAVTLVLMMGLSLTLGTALADPEKKTFDLGGRVVTLGQWGEHAPSPDSDTYAQTMALIEDIETRYNCTLEFFTTNDWHQYMEQVLISAISNDVYCDTFLYGAGQAAALAANDMLAPLDDIMDLNDPMWNQDTKEDWAIGGKHYWISDWETGFPRCMLFNKRVVEENGIDPQEIFELCRNGEWTWDKLLEFAQKCTKIVDGEYVSYGLGAFGSSPIMVEYLMYTNGTSPAVYGPNKELIYNMDDPAVVETMEFAYALTNEHKVVYTGSSDWGSWEEMWKAGKTAFFMIDTWQMENYYEPLAEDEFGIIMLPKGPRAENYVNIQDMPCGWVIQSSEPDKEAIGSLLTEYFYPYDWREENSKTIEEQWEDRVFDDESLEMVLMYYNEADLVPRVGDENSWFQGNILWSDFGLMSKTPPRTWIAERKAEIERAFAEAAVLVDPRTVEEDAPTE